MEALKSILSAQYLFSIIRVTTPLLFASMAAVVIRRAGIICIAFEGMMLFAAFGGVLGSALTQSVLGGIACGVLFGMLIAMVYAYFVLSLKANTYLTGLAINMLGSGGTVFLLYLSTGDKGVSTALNSLVVPSVKIPLVKDIPILGEVLSGHNALTYLAFLTVIAVYFLINKTVLGLRIRSVGENASAAASVGIKVVRTQFIAIVIGGLLASFGGLYMSMGYLPFFTRDMIAGRGFIGIAAQNLGGAMPIPTMLAALAFGAAEAASNILQSLRLPAEFMQMIPYAATLIGLMLVGRPDVPKRPHGTKRNRGGIGHE